MFLNHFTKHGTLEARRLETSMFLIKNVKSKNVR